MAKKKTSKTPRAPAVAVQRHCSELDDYSTDDLLERLPSHLHLARNDNAPEHDRWRMYNIATGEYIAPGYSTAREVLIHFIARRRTKDDLE